MDAEAVATYREVVERLDQSARLRDVLPIALRLAKELDDQGFEKWVRLELHGYFNSNPVLAEEDVVPTYRTVAIQHEDEFGRPLIITDPDLGFVNETRLRFDVVQLEEIVRDSKDVFVPDAGLAQLVQQHLGVHVVRYRLRPGAVAGVLSGIRTRLYDLLHERRPTAGGSAMRQVEKANDMASQEKIFIGHGRSRMWRDLKDFLQDRLQLSWDEFNRESPAGKTTSARLEQMLNSAVFAFLVMTAEDEQVDGSVRARENVIHEVGLFQGKLGLHRAVVLLEDCCTEFSNIHGLGQIRFPKDNIMACSEEVRRVLEREGLL